MMKFHKQLALVGLSAGVLVAGHSSMAAVTIDFEDGTVGSAPVGWMFNGDTSVVQVVATTDSGSYVGGQAINTDSSGASFAGFAASGFTPTALQADVKWDYREAPATGAGTPTIYVMSWVDGSQANPLDSTFQSTERGVGFAMDNDLDFEFLEDAGPELDGTTSTGFSFDTWYRLTMTWSDANGLGERDLTLSAIDLTNSTDLGVINTITMTAAQFGADPSEWDGVAFRLTRGTIDNIVLVPEPTSLALLGLGGLLIARRRRG